MSERDDARRTFETVLNQIPERCRRCPFALQLIGLAWAYDETTGAFVPTVADILENCVDDGLTDVDDSQAEVIGSDNAPLLSLPISGSTANCLYRDPRTREL